MAKIERRLHGDFNKILREVEDEILNGSVSASLEERSDCRMREGRLAVRVFERYSWLGGNRLSLTVTMLDMGDGTIFFSAIAAGGSNAVFFKVNHWGEDNFLGCVEDIVDRYCDTDS